MVCRPECGISDANVAMCAGLIRQGPARGRRLSHSLDRGAEPRQRLLEIIVVDIRQACGDRGPPPDRIGGAALRARRARSGACRNASRSTARQPRNWLTRSQMTTAKMLDLDRGRPLDAQDQRAGSAVVAGGGRAAIGS